jgi:EAL domain-containing protein (putative c-di-GMP-specific phosphodiesterase class I)
VVKLDMSLIRGIDADARRRRLLKSMVGGFRDLRTLTIAAGVETKAELDALLELGCDVFQGFLFSKPGPPFPAVTWH